VSTAVTQTNFIQDAIAENLSGVSSFNFRDLKRQVATVYIVLPEGELVTSAKWFRLIIASALNALLQPERGVPVMMILDEFYLLGNLAQVHRSLSASAGFGLQFWPVVQFLGQLESCTARAGKGSLLLLTCGNSSARPTQPRPGPFQNWAA